MTSIRLAAALAAAALCASGMVFAEGAKLSDQQIAHIAYTAGQLDISAAEQAKEKSSNKDVRAFADDMERDHKAVNEKALALVKKLGVTPPRMSAIRSSGSMPISLCTRRPRAMAHGMC
jgi:putative membrane protein